jgi:uncharacterized membrane protein
MVNKSIQGRERMYSIKNINHEHDSQLSFGDRVADKVASVMGSWSFIIIQSVLLIIWILLNTIALIAHWDSYPYVLLNLALSFQAAFATPVILMSQNRQSSKDRLMAEHDYEINMKAFNHLSRQEIQIILSNEKQDRLLEMIQVGNNELCEQTKMLIRLLQGNNKSS